MDLRSIMNTSDPTPPPPPNKVPKLSELQKVHDHASLHSQAHFLNSPSHLPRQSPLDISPRSSSYTQTEATPSPYTTMPQAMAISPRHSYSSVPESVASPQTYRSSGPRTMSSPHIMRAQSLTQPMEHYGNGVYHDTTPVQTTPLNHIHPQPARCESSISVSKPRRQKIREKPVWAYKVSDWNRLHPDALSQPPAENKGSHSSTPNLSYAPPPHLQQPPPQQQSTLSGRPLSSPTPTWEPTITNLIPSEELSRKVADFLFQHVVQRDSFVTGSSFTGSLEIEAKIGQIINRDTDDRLRLPILTETIIARSDLRTTFRSSMTEAQHRHFNQYLNEALTKTLPKKAAPNGPPATPSNRVRMDYKHTREVDKFYDLTPQAEAELPPQILVLMKNQRAGGAKARVRVTTDQKTGAELAKIIKIRLADMEVLSPNTAFDWRVSVNLELDTHIGREGMIEVLEQGKKVADRNKDRVTYLHQAYRIDLTQVTMGGTAAAAGPQADKEHELEIEVSTEDIKREGEAVLRGEESRYEDLVRGLVDNVRVLTRSCKI